MKSVNAIFTFLLVLCPLAADAQQDSTTVTRSAQGDACKSENDSIAWNKELEGLVVNNIDVYCLFKKLFLSTQQFLSKSLYSLFGDWLF